MITQANVKISDPILFSGHKDCIYGLAKNPLNETFYSSSGDGMIVEWDPKKDNLGIMFAQFSNSIYSMSLWDTKLVVGQNKEGIHIIDIETKKEDYSLKLTSDSIFDIKILDHYAIVATGNGEIILVDLILKKVIKRDFFSTKSARSISIHPSKTFFLAGFSDHTLKMISMNHFDILKSTLVHTNSVFAIENYNSVFITGGRDAQLRFLKSEVDDLELKHSISAHLYAINDIKISPNNKILATASMDKTIKIWDFETLKLLKVIDSSRYNGHKTSINKLIWLNDETLISASDDRKVLLWSIKY